MKIVKSREDSCLLLKGLSKTIQNKEKKTKKKEFFSTLLGTLGANLLNR